MSEMALELIRRAKKEGWKRLDLGNTGIVGGVPEEVGELEELEELVLSEEWQEWIGNNWVRSYSVNTGPSNEINYLSSKPPQNLKLLLINGTQVADLSPLEKLTHLQTLWLSDTQVIDLMPLRNLTKLIKLNCYNTKVYDLSPLRNHKKLHTLDCSNTQVIDLSPLGNLKNLITLWCYNTLVSDLAPLENLTQLKILHFSGTEVSDLAPVGNLTQLKSLHFSRTQVPDLTPLEKLTQLQKLFCSDTQFTDLTPLEKLTQLQTIQCSRTQVSDLRPLEKLTQLQKLDCSNTQVSDLGPIGKLTQLRQLECSLTLVSDLMPLKKLIQLELIDFSRTQVADLTPIGNLKQLHTLQCSHTQVADLSPLENLTGLNTLNCWNTQIADLKPIKVLIQKWANNEGQGIKAFGCPLISPPAEIVDQGNAAILAYWAEQDRKKTIPANEIKLFLLGNTTAGKSTMRDSLCEGKWVEQSSTHGALLNKTWNPENESIQVNIWDFGGQEYYHSTHSLYLGSNSLYATVVDPLLDKSGDHPTPISYFDKNEPQNELLEHFPHDYWLEMVAKNNSQNKVFLVWNKLDQDNLPHFGASDHDRKLFLPPGHLEEYKISLQGALSDKLPEWKGRWALLKADLANAAKKALQGQEWITYWPVIKADLEKESQTRLEMPLDEFKARCAWWANNETGKPFEGTAEIEFLDDAVWENIVIYLREMTGTILYWPDGDLSKQVFINPHKINELIYAILNREAKDNEGRFNHAHAIAQIPKGLDAVYGEGNWTENPETMADTVLKIMHQFGIVFEVAEKSGEFVAPQYLGREEPDLVKNNQEEYFEEAQTIEFVFSSYIPRYIIPQFIARKGRLAESKKYWKYGILFRENLLYALVQAFYDLNIIRLKVEKGEGEIELIRKIYEGLKELWGESSKIRIRKENGQSVAIKELDLHRSHHNRICRTVDGNEMDVMEFLPFLPEGEYRRYYTPKESKPMNKKRHIHICYSDTDKDKPFLESLVQNFRAIGKNWDFTFWSQADAIPGSVLLDQVKMSISKAEVIIFLMSIDLISSKESNIQFDYSESTKQALERNCLVIPIKIRSFFGFENLPVGKYPTPLGVEVLNLEKDIDQAWEKVISWMVKVFDQVNSHGVKGIESPSNLPIAQGMDIKLDELMAGPKNQIEIFDKDNTSGSLGIESPSILQIAQGMDKKLDELMADSKKQIEQNEVILNRVNDTYSRLMHKLQSMSDFDNEAYQKLTILGEKTYWSVLESQEQYKDRNDELDLVLQSIIAKIAERSPETAERLTTDLVPAKELSNGRKFLQSIKLKLPVIGLAIALVATGGAAWVGLGLATALAGSIEWETNMDAALQKLIGGLKSLDKPLPDNWQPKNWK